MALKLYKDTVIPQFHTGHWVWNRKKETFNFEFTGKATVPDYAIIPPKNQFGIQFKDYMDQVEEIIFRKHFQRTDESKDNDVITIQDIKDVVLYMSSSAQVSEIFIDFLHTKTTDEFLNDLIIYFEYFLKTVEFLLIRRDEVSGDQGKIRDLTSVHVEKMLSEYLCQYRLILARSYSKILLGENDVARYHHMANKMKKSKTENDQIFFEQFIYFCTRIVWVAMHRKGYRIIDYEVNRLFRSGHFNVAQAQIPDCIKFTFREEQILYGPNDTRCNYRNQRSPLMLEILNIKPKNTDILWIGEKKYRGTNKRLYQLELEYVTPPAQLSFIDCHHGILGNPKTLYNTMLSLDWRAVREENFSETYDPYQLVRRPYVYIPDWEYFNKHHEKNEAYFKMINDNYDKYYSQQRRKTWKNKENIITSFGNVDIMDDNIISKCTREIKTIGKTVVIDREKIISKFLREKQRKLKF